MGAAELFAAIRGGDLAAAEAELAADPALDGARDDGGLSAVLTAAYYRRGDILAALLARGPALSLYEAAAAGDTARAAALLDTEPGLLHALAPDGFPALGLACYFGRAETAAMLMARGADVNQASGNPMRVAPLHAAVSGGHLGIAGELVARGADVNAAQQDSFRPLHGAAQNGQAAMVELLLAHGADRAARTAAGLTPRDVALAAGHAAVAEML